MARSLKLSAVSALILVCIAALVAAPAGADPSAPTPAAPGWDAFAPGPTVAPLTGSCVYNGSSTTYYFLYTYGYMTGCPRSHLYVNEWLARNGVRVQTGNNDCINSTGCSAGTLSYGGPPQSGTWVATVHGYNSIYTVDQTISKVLAIVP